MSSYPIDDEYPVLPVDLSELRSILIYRCMPYTELVDTIRFISESLSDNNYIVWQVNTYTAFINILYFRGNEANFMPNQAHYPIEP